MVSESPLGRATIGSTSSESDDVSKAIYLAGDMFRGVIDPRGLGPAMQYGRCARPLRFVVRTSDLTRWMILPRVDVTDVGVDCTSEMDVFSVLGLSLRYGHAASFPAVWAIHSDGSIHEDVWCVGHWWAISRDCMTRRPSSIGCSLARGLRLCVRRVCRILVLRSSCSS